MREKIFRGLTVATKPEWVYGHYVCLSGVCNQHRIFPFGCSLHGSVAVYGETVGQFTEKTDKNCRRIFEGDIVIAKWPYAKKCTCVWDKGRCGFLFIPVEGDGLRGRAAYDKGYKLNSAKCEVIGTIHDEMIKEVKNV